MISSDLFVITIAFMFGNELVCKAIWFEWEVNESQGHRN